MSRGSETQVQEGKDPQPQVVEINQFSLLADQIIVVLDEFDV